MPRARAIAAAIVLASSIGLLVSCDQQTAPQAPAPTAVPTATVTAPPQVSNSLLPESEPTGMMPLPLPQAWPTLTFERSAQQTYDAAQPTAAPPPPTATPIPPTYTPTEQQIAAREAIKTVKAATVQLQIYPHIYGNEGGEYNEEWPDQPGSVQGYYLVCGEGPPPTAIGGGYNYTCEEPMTLTTELVPDSQGQGRDVIFTATWAGPAQTYYTHSWRYNLSDNNVAFIREEGDPLPLIQEP